MSRSTYRLTVDVSGVLEAVDGNCALIQANVGHAVGGVAQEGASRWKDAVKDAKLREAEKDAYIESIGWEMTGPMEAVVFATYRHAAQIETGRPERDLKKNLQSSKKTRIAQSGPHKGQRYLVIPFQHNTPTASGKGAHGRPMPAAIYKIAKNLPKSQNLPLGSKRPATRFSASGHAVQQRSYAWGGRLPARLAPKLKAHHRTDPYAGMVRFDTSVGRAKSSSYITFRVMGEWSSGWIVPPTSGLYLAKGVSQSLHGVLEEAIGKAVSVQS